MEDGTERIKPKANKKKGRLLMVLSAVIVVAVLATALVFASGLLAPGAEDDPQNSNNGEDTNSDTSEDTLVNRIASDFILNQSDIGSDWTASDIATGLDIGPMNASITSSAMLTFKQYNSTGQLEYVVEIVSLVFDSINNASAYYNKSIEIHPEDDSYLPPEYRPSYTVIIANVSIGDGGVIFDLPRITLGHEAKALVFVDRNVLCGITYHDATSFDPLPNELLIDLANKVETKIA